MYILSETKYPQFTNFDSNGFFGCCSTYDDQKDDELTGHISGACFKVKHICGTAGSRKHPYLWLQFSASIYWSLSEGVNLVICVNAPEKMQNQLKTLARAWDKNKTDPFTWYVVMAYEIAKEYDASVQALRNVVRHVELERLTPQYVESDFHSLHDIERHAIHSNETLDVAVDSLESMIEQHSHLQRDCCMPTGVDHGKAMVFKKTHVKLGLVLKKLRAIRARSKTIEERLKNEISLAFNLVSQRDSQSAVALAEDAKSDSSAMRIIAVVSAIFLPGTFVSSLFGMNFFALSNTAQSRLIMSDDFWLYWVVTIPVTSMTCLAWGIWCYWPTLSKEKSRSGEKDPV
ncbi:uncharacterized protein K452DRAFT_63428 [Aplosporella prunicola CBS 121167]|uniref:Uncharacterized protein n=1 Tax=Aplosporella prunicola CBS 121167 TaxID=1176127 RepID=A0A6A6B8V5_9PEZI|nr:uncharacterized protein K452DRAFT_63428 [Aplosporella prunicola CBS 121167]KAF2139634.1 hypothetical protein K452DRAFT_63428 [Aplosporella prunicola CBS 121167]